MSKTQNKMLNIAPRKSDKIQGKKFEVSSGFYASRKCYNKLECFEYFS
jgi:hypothetical protein